MRWMVVNATLLTVLVGAVGAAQVLDRSPVQIDSTVERYARAVEAQDLEAAIIELSPAARDLWTPWVAEQLGNIYQVRAVSIRAPSPLDRLIRGTLGQPTEATVVMDVNRGYPEFFFQPSTRVSLEQHDGRWYLAEPLLSRESVE